MRKREYGRVLFCYSNIVDVLVERVHMHLGLKCLKSADEKDISSGLKQSAAKGLSY